MPSLTAYFNTAANISGAGDAWSNSQNAENVPDGSYASVSIIGNDFYGYSQILALYNWLEGIPPNNIIEKIEVGLYCGWVSQSSSNFITIHGYNNNTGNQYISEYLTSANLPQNSWSNYFDITNLFKNDSTISFPTYSDLNSGKVGCGITLQSVKQGSVYYTATLDIDSVRMRVSYGTGNYQLADSIKVEEFPAPEHLYRPKPRLLDRRKFKPFWLPLNQSQGTGLAQSFAHASIAINRSVESTVKTQSKANVNSNIQRALRSQAIAQSESVRCSFYFAAIVNLKATGLSQSFDYVSYYLNNPVTIQQLVAKAFSVSYVGNPCIYYVNFGGKAVSQSFISEASKARTVNLQGAVHTQPYFRADVSKYKYLMALTCEAISQSDSIAEISRRFNIYSSSIITQSQAYAQEIITRPLNAKALEQSEEKGNVTIKRNITSIQTSSSFAKGNKSQKLGMYSNPTSPSFMRSSSIITRPISANANSQSFAKPSTSISRKLNGIAISPSIDNSNEKITRVFNGVAESISIAQKCGYFIHRLYVSNSISYSFSRSPISFNRHMYSAMYSQSFIHGNEVVTKQLQATTKSSNPFHGNRSLSQNISGPAASATMSFAEKTVQKNINAAGKSNNPFHANPNLQKELQAAALTDSMIKAEIAKKLNLTAPAYSQVHASVEEIIARQLAASSKDVSFSDAEITKQDKLTSQAISVTQSKAQESVNKHLNSQVISDSFSDADVSIKRNVDGKVISQTSIQVDENKKLNLTSKVVLQSQIHTQEIVQRNISAEGIDQSEADTKGFNTLKNLLAKSIATSELHANLLNKQIDFEAIGISQSYISGTDTYLGNKQANLGYVETVSQDVINLAPFNYPDEKDSSVNPD